jgi:hypothetical protein
MAGKGQLRKRWIALWVKQHFHNLTIHLLSYIKTNRLLMTEEILFCVTLGNSY